MQGLKPSLVLAMLACRLPMSNDDLRRAIGRPAMPQCTVTWHLNELADWGLVHCNRQGRYNRWALTEKGLGLSGVPDGITLSQRLAAMRAPQSGRDVVHHAIRTVPRTVFDIALIAAPREQLDPSKALRLRMLGRR